jgi:hypothetical protein
MKDFRHIRNPYRVTDDNAINGKEKNDRQIIKFIFKYHQSASFHLYRSRA